MKFTVPSSSVAPQRPQLRYFLARARTVAMSIGSGMVASLSRARLAWRTAFEEGAVENHGEDLPEVADLRRRVAADEEEVGALPDFDGAEVGLGTREKTGIVRRGGAQCLGGRHAGLDELRELEVKPGAGKI